MKTIFKTSHIAALPLLVFSIIGLTTSCNQKAEEQPAPVIVDPLPSWNNGAHKSAIVQFVEESINTQSKSFVPIAERIAVFDNDGTLWSEKPVYFQLFFAADRLKEMANDHPEWKENQPFKAALENDIEELKKYGVEGLLKIVMASHTGMTTEEFEQSVTDWISVAKHPRFNRPYTDLVFQPMLELISYLKANEFKVFIVSGGGMAFMRPWAESVYGIPRHQIIGSSMKTEFTIENNNPQINRLPEIEFIDDKEGKPVGIDRHIGRKPIFCSGNSDGDLAMMQWTDSGNGERFMLYIHHTDSTREWAYDRDSHIGRFDEALDIAKAKGWTITDMAQDWKVVYPFEMEQE
jgi:phosphoglycolate phosphatase-like HAD superfamily hydrolase